MWGGFLLLCLFYQNLGCREKKSWNNFLKPNIKWQEIHLSQETIFNFSMIMNLLKIAIAYQRRHFFQHFDQYSSSIWAHWKILQFETKMTRHKAVVLQVLRTMPGALWIGCFSSPPTPAHKLAFYEKEQKHVIPALSFCPVLHQLALGWFILSPRILFRMYPMDR